MTSTLLMFWGKTGGRGNESAWHPALWHMLDVGTVAEAMLASSLPRRAGEFLAGGLGISVDRVGAWAAYLAALHDIGKISSGFQGKVPALRPRPEADWPSRSGECQDHTAVSFQVLRECLRSHLTNVQARELALALSGHHGSFPDGSINPLAGELGRWRGAREACIEELQRAFQVDWLELRPSVVPTRVGVNRPGRR
jgi:CRISPR-associated endonuclease/helicase Cas3